MRMATPSSSLTASSTRFVPMGFVMPLRWYMPTMARPATGISHTSQSYFCRAAVAASITMPNAAAIVPQITPTTTA